MKLNRSLLAVGIVLLLGVAVALYKLHFGDLWGNVRISAALALSAVVLVGLALVVVLMCVLVIIYSVIGVVDSTQALALPEGSVRALIAFSLVLIFVCLGAFLYNSLNESSLSPGGKVNGITEAQLTDLQAQFVVVYEQARNANGSTQTDNEAKAPLYNATYFIKPNKDAGDFAKQIFTTLATVFVSVISFYFGSSTTSSAIGTGAKVASGGTGGGGAGGSGGSSGTAAAGTAATASGVGSTASESDSAAATGAVGSESAGSPGKEG